MANTKKHVLSLVAAFLTTVVILFSGCAEQAGSGVAVTIPTVQVNCVTARCRATATARAFIVYTTSGCANASFGETVAGSTYLSCNSTGCSGTVSSFTSSLGLSTTLIAEGYYAVCVVIDFNSNYIGSAIVGEDSTGSQATSFVTNGSTARIVSAFSDL